MSNRIVPLRNESASRFNCTLHAIPQVQGKSSGGPDKRSIRTWELLRFHSKLEKSSDEVEDVKDDRPIGPASKRFDLLASRLTL